MPLIPFVKEDLKKLDKIFKLFSILDTTDLDCKKALHSNLSDYEDALMVETALRCRIDCIITRNTKDFSKASIKTRLPRNLRLLTMTVIPQTIVLLKQSSYLSSLKK